MKAAGHTLWLSSVSSPAITPTGKICNPASCGKQAPFQAIDLISRMPPDSEKGAILNALRELAEDLPITGWDAKTLLDTVEQFFLDTFYPQQYNFVHESIRKYREHHREHWLDIFKEQMAKHQIRTATEYNRKRTEGPGWAYIAHLFGFKTWKQLVTHAEVKIPPKPRDRIQFTVSSRTNHPDIETPKKIQAKLQDHMLPSLEENAEQNQQ